MAAMVSMVDEDGLGLALLSYIGRIAPGLE
jgi:hypothetical protein